MAYQDKNGKQKKLLLPKLLIQIPKRNHMLKYKQMPVFQQFIFYDNYYCCCCLIRLMKLSLERYLAVYVKWVKKKSILGAVCSGYKSTSAYFISPQSVAEIITADSFIQGSFHFFCYFSLVRSSTEPMGSHTPHTC